VGERFELLIGGGGNGVPSSYYTLTTGGRSIMNTAKVVSVCMNIIRKSLKYSQTNFSAILAIVFCDSNRPDVRYSIFGRKDFWNQSYLDIFHSSGRKTWRSEELIIHANEPLNILPSASEYRIVLKDSSTVQDTAFFHSLAHN